ncbi:hypothetical protein Enr10x_02240 [Gimesia panareensis]|uniref:Uncharacterized protein n=1 Tax=Gimesia panareensis TaxID=2527978 RepID=A0A517ZZN8_9PLAN|nr:hypothetical protein Enr10x_02240 [Gimesia panareensis]QDU47913.1 hypothetical protein Pan110_02230 [Gimesia panareensis]
MKKSEGPNAERRCTHIVLFIMIIGITRINLDYETFFQIQRFRKFLNDQSPAVEHDRESALA